MSRQPVDYNYSKLLNLNDFRLDLYQGTAQLNMRRVIKSSENNSQEQGRVIMSGMNRMTEANHRVPLGLARKGFSGRIDAVGTADASSGIPAGEIERRLIELGFVEGARVEILHEGLIGRDPIAVRVNDATVALRRREAMAILVS